jgi:hypothetical protein
MAGGAPAGIKILPGEAGCRTKSTRMRIRTTQGKSTTTPSGTDMLELPRSLRGLRKKARRDRIGLGRVCGCLPFSSEVGSAAVGEDDEEPRLTARRTKSIVTDHPGRGLIRPQGRAGSNGVEFDSDSDEAARWKGRRACDEAAAKWRQRDDGTSRRVPIVRSSR